MTKLQLALLIIIYIITKCECSINYSNVTTINSNEDYTINVLPNYNTIIINITIIKTNVSNIMSIYLFDIDKYMIDRNIEKFNDLLDNNCKNVTSCNQKVNLDQDIDYIILISNPNDFNNITIYYYISEYNDMEGLYVILGTFLSCLVVIIFIITIVIIRTNRNVGFDRNKC